MTPAQRAAAYRRQALACERKANYWAGENKPWAIPNSRAYLNLMSRAMGARNAILTRYLTSRKRRTIQ